MAGAWGLSMSMLLASCASDADSRSAAAFDEAAGQVTVGGPNVAPTRVCIVNSSGTPINVTFSKKQGSSGEGTLSGGSKACAEGSSVSGDDVMGTIRASKWSRSYSFGAVNKTFSLPSAFIHVDGGGCPENRSDFFENASANHGDGVLRFALKRLKDPKAQSSDGSSNSQYKDFLITVTDESARTPDTVPAACW